MPDHPHHRRQLRARRRDGPPVRRPAATTWRCAPGGPTASRRSSAEIAAAAPGRPRRGPGARRQRPRRRSSRCSGAFRDRLRHPRPGRRQRRARQGRSRSAPAASTPTARPRRPTSSARWRRPRRPRRSSATQNAGHLVMISSISAMRGMPGNITTYAATKAGVAHLAEGVRADVMGTPIKVTVLYPGYIVSEMTATLEGHPAGRLHRAAACASMVDGDREGEGLRPGPGLALGAARLRPQAPAAADRPPADGLSCVVWDGWSVDGRSPTSSSQLPRGGPGDVRPAQAGSPPGPRA